MRVRNHNLNIIWFKDMKLRNKLIFNYICFGLLPLLLVGAFGIYKVQTVMFSQEAVRNQDYLKQAVSALNGQLKVYDNLSDYISFSSSVSRICEDKYESEYNRYLDYTEGFHSLVGSMKYFHDEIQRITLYVDKPIVEYEDSIMPTKGVKTESWYEVVKQDNEVHWFVSKDKKKVFSARKIPSLSDEKMNHILYIEIDYGTLFDWFENMTDTDYGVYLVDEEEEILYEAQKFSKGNRDQILDFSSVKEEGEKQEHYIVTKQEIGENGWSVYLYRSSDGISQKINGILKEVIWGVIVSIILSVFFIRLITNHTVKGIEQLRGNMKEVEEGKLEFYIQTDSKDEIGDLIRGFGEMLTKIKVLVEEVYEGKIKQKEYEMRALQAQINPHFLYNSLSLINWMAIEEGHEDISKITLAMSSFYRTALNKGNNIILLKNEIENMKSYLEIQLMMHDYEFDTEIQIEEGLEDFLVLNLILQPMVENAIDHGIDLKTQGRGKVSVTAKSEGDTIVIVVEDNGVGMEQSVIDTILTKKSKGYGLRNVNERIKLYYGEEYHLTIESERGVGTKIITKIPKVKEEKA